MKVVLFCGGMGMRMRTSEESLPKPMTPVGHRPVLWHIMRYYAHYGHKEFILCLGYGAKAVKDYFLNYEETASNDFVLRNGGRDVDLLGSDIDDWKITFVDTGMETPIGERLRRVRTHLGDDPVFLANYGDVLTDAPVPEVLAKLDRGDAIASFVSVKPPGSFHVVQTADGSRVTGFVPVTDLDIRINGGYFALRSEIFDYLDEGEDLVGNALVRAAALGRVEALEYDGFWAPMDTLKERAELEKLYYSGRSPWMVWQRPQERTALEPAQSIEVPEVSLA